MKKKRVVVALSGGVDSSVAAYLLAKQNYDVIAIFMKNWHNDTLTKNKECPWIEDSTDAMLVAQKLGIPFQAIDLSKEYTEKIVHYMFDEYKQGKTPNPDILCNKEIKFDVFLKTALSLNADYIATGHYCQKKSFFTTQGKEVFQLYAGTDVTKDQSYFLCQISQEQLKKTLFPIGTLKKKDVRKIAKKQKLITAHKKDSQGLCFVGKIKLPDFLKQKLSAKKGAIIEIQDREQIPIPIFKNVQEKLIFYTKKRKYNASDGKVIGQHNGAHFFTIGQRKGLAVGGYTNPLFIIDTDTKKNIVYVGHGKNHSDLWRKGLKISPEKIHWIRPDKMIAENDTLEVDVRIRYRQPLQKATLYQQKKALYILFDKEQHAITSGQFAAWYINMEIVGSGVIE